MRSRFGWCLLPLLAACSGGTTDDLGAPHDAAIDGGAKHEPADAGLDAGPGSHERDAGSLDAGSLDAGSMDAGSLDAGSMDAGSLDAGSLDAGSLDAGSLDAGNAPVDAGTELDAMTLVDAGSPLDGGTHGLVTSLDFEGDSLPASIDPGAGGLAGSQGFADLGHDGNKFGPTFLRSPSPNVVTLTLTDLPAHSSIDLAFLFAAIDSLDGAGAFPAGDYFRIDLDGSTLFREAFANATDSEIQTYNPPPGVVLARRVDLGFGGPGGYYTDSAYDMGLDPAFQNIPHSASTATFTFTLEGDGVQSLDDESWAIDNLRVKVGNSPRSVDAGAPDGSTKT